MLSSKEVVTILELLGVNSDTADSVAMVNNRVTVSDNVGVIVEIDISAEETYGWWYRINPNGSRPIISLIREMSMGEYNRLISTLRSLKSTRPQCQLLRGAVNQLLVLIEGQAQKAHTDLIITPLGEEVYVGYEAGLPILTISMDGIIYHPNPNTVTEEGVKVKIPETPYRLVHRLGINAMAEIVQLHFSTVVAFIMKELM